MGKGQKSHHVDLLSHQVTVYRDKLRQSLGLFFRLISGKPGLHDFLGTVQVSVSRHFPAPAQPGQADTCSWYALPISLRQCFKQKFPRKKTERSQKYLSMGRFQLSTMNICRRPATQHQGPCNHSRKLQPINKLRSLNSSSLPSPSPSIFINCVHYLVPRARL